MLGSFHISYHNAAEIDWWDDYVKDHSLPFFYSFAWLRQFESENKNTGFIQVTSDSDDLLVVWPIHSNRRLGFHRILLPPLTPYNTPVQLKKLSKEASNIIASKLSTWLQQHTDIAQLREPTSPVPSFSFPLDLNQRESQITLVIPSELSPEERFASYPKQHRYDIRRARREGLTVTKQVSADQLYDVWTLSLRYQKHTIPLSRPQFNTLVSPSPDAPWSVTLLGVISEQNELAAALALFHDTNRAYVLVSGINRSATEFAAGALLHHEAIAWCFEQNLSLDFEGSQHYDIRRFYQKFNPSEQQVMLQSSAPSSRLRVVDTLKSIIP